MKGIVGCGWVVAVAWGACGVMHAEEWRVQGEFLSLADGRPAVAILKLEDGTRLEVPIAALAEPDRQRIQRAPGSAKPPAGRPPVAGSAAKSVDAAGRAKVEAAPDTLPAVLKDVEAAAASCRSAIEASRVYRLFMAGEELSGEERAVAEQRLAHWKALAAERRVRAGAGWITPDEARAAAGEAESLIVQAAEKLRLQNIKLAIDDLHKAVRVDVVSGRAAFFLGALSGDPAKAAEYYADAVRRDPADGYALNNLAVCEAVSRKAAAVSHFRQAAGVVPEAQVVADNVGLIVANANKTPRWKMPDKVAAEYAALYQSLTGEGGLKPVDLGVESLKIFGPDGQPRALSDAAPTPQQIASAIADAVRARIVRPDVLGVVVSPKHVLAPVVEEGAACTLRVAGTAEPIPATVVTVLEGTGFGLLTADKLPVEPLLAGDAVPAAGGRISFSTVGPGALATSSPLVVAGTVLPGASDDAFAFAAEAAGARGGGAIVDPAGRLVGLVMPTPLTTPAGWAEKFGRGLGLPVAAIRLALKEHGIQLEATESGSPTAADELRERLVKATVVVSMRPARPTATPGPADGRP